MSSRQDEINSPEVQGWQRGGTGGRWGSEAPTWCSVICFLSQHFCFVFSLSCSQGMQGRRLAGLPLHFTGRNQGQDNHLINPKSTLFWTRDRRMHQIRTARVWFPRVWAYLSLFARFLSSEDVSGACVGASPDCFFFSASHYRKKGTSAVFKEQGWEENPSDSICLMTALAHSLWKWWAANDVSVGKNPKHVCFLFSLKSSGLRRGCRNNHCLGNQGSI